MCTIFQGVGEKRLWDIEGEIKKLPLHKRMIFSRSKAQELVIENIQIVKDYYGFIFFCATDQFLSITMAQILQMPELTSVYVREMSNKMYCPTSFFLARWLVSTLIYAFQPLIYSLMVFAFIGLPTSTFEHFQKWLVLSIFSSLILGTTLGMMFSVIFKKNIDAIISANMFLCFFYFSSG